MSESEKAAAKKKRDIIITSVLLVVFAYTFTTNVLMRKKGKVLIPVDTVQQQAAGSESQVMADQLVYVTNLRVYDKLRDDQKAVWEKEWGRDPFTPQELFSNIVKAVNLSLQGVLWDPEKPKAIVNEKTLYVGDTLYGYTVVEIKPRSVILKTGEKDIELSLCRGNTDPGSVPAV
jgi:hypothetical protein